MNNFYTSIEQSKKLLSLGMNPESADMYYTRYQSITNPKEWEYEDTPNVRWEGISFGDKRIFYPAWSLGALLELMPKLPRVEYDLVQRQEECYVAFDDLNKNIHEDYKGNTPFEAVYNMVVWLLEQHYL